MASVRSTGIPHTCGFGPHFRTGLLRRMEEGKHGMKENISKTRLSIDLSNMFTFQKFSAVTHCRSGLCLTMAMFLKGGQGSENSVRYIEL